MKNKTTGTEARNEARARERYLFRGYVEESIKHFTTLQELARKNCYSKAEQEDLAGVLKFFTESVESKTYRVSPDFGALQKGLQDLLIHAQKMDKALQERQELFAQNKKEESDGNTTITTRDSSDNHPKL